MINKLEHFGKRFELQKEGSSNRICQVESCLTTTVDEIEQYIDHVIPAYTDKRVGILKKRLKR